MKNKAEKVIIFLYWFQVFAFLQHFFTALINREEFYMIMPRAYSAGVATFFFPLFLILTFLYKKKYKTLINNKLKNNFAKILAFISIAIFFILFIEFLVMVVIDKNFIWVNFFISDVTSLFWPIILLLFAINFHIKKDISQRFYNLKYFLFSMFIFGFLPIIVISVFFFKIVLALLGS